MAAQQQQHDATHHASHSHHAKPEDVYSDPELRARLKDEIMAGDKGGKPGQWSARKAQLLVHEYEKAGGGYKHPGELTDEQKHLHEWTEEDWHTQSGKPSLETGERYLPDAAFDQLTPEQVAEANEAKQEGLAHGEQFVPNPPAARDAVREVRDEAERP